MTYLLWFGCLVRTHKRPQLELNTYTWDLYETLVFGYYWDRMHYIDNICFRPYFYYDK